jgi:hypothetical protein
MQIIQEITESEWIVMVAFGEFTFTDGHGPFFMVGDFNNWKVADEQYKINQPPQGGANCLTNFTLELPKSINSLEFKIWDSYSLSPLAAWKHPEIINGSGSIYENYNDVVKNPYGTFNIKVSKISP